jgi:hypothetical protein
MMKGIDIPSIKARSRKRIEILYRLLASRRVGIKWPSCCWLAARKLVIRDDSVSGSSKPRKVFSDSPSGSVRSLFLVQSPLNWSAQPAES